MMYILELEIKASQFKVNSANEVQSSTMNILLWRVILTPAETPLPTAAPLINQTSESDSSEAQAVVQLVAEEGPQEWFTRFIAFFESYAQGKTPHITVGRDQVG